MKFKPAEMKKKKTKQDTEEARMDELKRKKTSFLKKQIKAINDAKGE